MPLDMVWRGGVGNLLHTALNDEMRVLSILCGIRLIDRRMR